MPNSRVLLFPLRFTADPQAVERGNMMKILICSLLILILAGSAMGASEPPLSEPDKASVKEALADALKSKRITQQQYTQAISWVDATPCQGVDRDFSKKGKGRLTNAIKKQLRLQAVDVLQIFGSEGWTIVYVDTKVSDEPYLFYSVDPIVARKPVTQWSGAAMIFETSEVERWVLDHAPDIPKRLAACFAWHVTLNRD